MNEFLNDPYEIAKFIKNATKKTPVKAYIKGNLSKIDFNTFKFFGDHNHGVVFGEGNTLLPFLENHKENIFDYVVELDRRNSAIPMKDISKVNARIEPGTWIREYVTIGDQAVIMMGSIINIGAVIGDRTMIDMNAVLGARATIGKDCHIGAGAVVAGVLEPPSATPTTIEDGVLVGANAVILEGVRVGEGAVVAAGAVVTEDVPENAVVAGQPARIVKYKDGRTIEKTKILDDLRK
ncbi:2,3,4,5-tetrahydropyridine-2,6-dicarboxylate N-acetyltransferase [Acholeplasma oculi]|uniref:2,3,4,5-tetrahydropyridine-2,6-dicarboxylate N-acetyltransferase n=1 Tax=Acholeplasma oculi TaxID=35623 RepID=A0A061AAU4_9MOLU|nr:2,3,4,5-tetrahydropyridine-2,6-dicarboxylate N-acetyltransferase [Acholeplasma oculi]CDR30968.1 2,3,4,5-Tetrahydropyridine-2,6-dicarboxylate N-acetyltransferase [Acholeplasma oculi]SKC35865.1 2,3,4,5-tetrahydropyridine-2,6-dicarboxylate N-acetyltransferase [Acholeplasma oculi]SUT90318.1 2,3,4,5-tetrahydropyridine-2,6-dicarboxylate N-acetyltransferase [Acholeplasma oculi]